MYFIVIIRLNYIKDTVYSIFNRYLGENIDKEVNDFIGKFNSVNEILKEMKSRQLLTFNDVTKYAKLRASTYKSFNITKIINLTLIHFLKHIPTYH